MEVSRALAGLSWLIASVTVPLESMAYPSATLAAAMRDEEVTTPVVWWSTDGQGLPPSNYHQDFAGAQAKVMTAHVNACGVQVRNVQPTGYPTNG